MVKDHRIEGALREIFMWNSNTSIVSSMLTWPYFWKTHSGLQWMITDTFLSVSWGSCQTEGFSHYRQKIENNTHSFFQPCMHGLNKNKPKPLSTSWFAKAGECKAEPRNLNEGTLKSAAVGWNKILEMEFVRQTWEKTSGGQWWHNLIIKIDT